MRTAIASPAQGSAEQLSELGSTKDPWYRRYPRRLLSPKDVARQPGQSRLRLTRSKSPNNDQARTQSPDDGRERQERPTSSGSELTPTPSIELRRSNTDLSAELPFSALFSQAGVAPAYQTTRRETRQRENDQVQALRTALTISNQKAELSLWQLAREELSSKEAKEFDKLFPRTDFRTYKRWVQELKSSVDRYQDSQWTLKKSDNTHVVVRNAIDKTVAWVNKLSEVGKPLAGLDPTGHANQVLGGLQFLIDAAIRNKATRDLVFDIERIEKVLKRCTLLESLYGLNLTQQLHESAQQLKLAQIVLYSKILRYLLAARRFMEQGTLHHGLNAVVGKDSPTEAMTEIRSAEEEVDTWAALVRREESVTNRNLDSSQIETLKNSLAKILPPIFQMKDEFRWMRDEFAAQKQERILQWISEVLPGNRHITIHEQRTPGTAEWLSTHPTFKEWKDFRSSCLLWMNGKGGAGKTMLSSAVIDQLQDECAQAQIGPYIFPDPNPPRLAFYYCDKANNANEIRSSLTILRCILRQLTTIRGYPLMRTIVDKYDNLHEQRHLTLKECKDLIVELCNLYPATFIVLDGLDECTLDVRDSVIDNLSNVLRSTSGRLKIFLSSRFEGDLDNLLQDVEYTLKVQPDDNQGDISLFVEREVRARVGRGLPRTLTLKQQEEIITILTAKADGMFRWVQLSLAALRQHRDPKDVMEHVGRLPPGLNAIYNEVMTEINSFSQHTLAMVQTTLNLLLYGQQGLSIQAFVYLVDSSVKNVKAKSVDIVDACRHFIEIDEKANIFRLSHASVKEYLTESYTGQEYSIPAGNCTIAKLCIDGLLTGREPFSGKGIRLSEGTGRAFHDYSIAALVGDRQTYETLFWPFHVAKSGHRRRQDPKLSEALEPLHVNNIALPTWFQEWIQPLGVTSLTPYGLSIDGRSYGAKLAASRTETLTSLFVICAFGYDELLGDSSTLSLKLLKTQNIWSASPLVVASEYGHTGVLRKLISRLENVRAKDPPLKEWIRRESIESLCIAAQQGQDSIVSLLLDHGTDVNAVNYDKTTALQAAVSGGHIDVIKTLLAREARLDVYDRRGNDILMLAILNGQVDAVRLLLSNSASVAISNRAGYSPLHQAAEVGSASITALLLEVGCELEVANKLGETALHVAGAGKSSTDVFSLLVEKGADTSATDKEGKTPLHTAAENGRVEILHILLNLAEYSFQSQIDVEARDDRGMTALHYATMSTASTVKTLVSSGADVNAERDDGLTPIELAQASGRGEEIMKIMQSCSQVCPLTI